MNPQGHRCVVKKLTIDEIKELTNNAKRAVILTDDQVISGAAIGRVTAIGDDVTYCQPQDCVLFVDRDPFSLSINDIFPDSFMVEEECLLAKLT